MKSFLMSRLKKSAVRHRSTLSTDTIITDVNQLLENDAQEDYRMLKAMKMSASVDQKMEKHGKLITINQKLREYGEVFHIEEIKDLACKYALKFLHSSCYKGAIDHAMFQKIRQFSQDKKLPIDDATLNYKMYLLAPPSAFRLSDKPRDPLLFYKLDSEHFVFVCKWGNDFTFIRRLTGLQRRNLFTLIASRWLPALFFLGLLHFTKYSIIPIALSALFGFGMTINTIAEHSREGGYLWAGTWDNEFTVRF